jgi:hypothetical protein
MRRRAHERIYHPVQPALGAARRRSRGTGGRPRLLRWLRIAHVRGSSCHAAGESISLAGTICLSRAHTLPERRARRSGLRRSTARGRTQPPRPPRPSSALRRTRLMGSRQPAGAVPNTACKGFASRMRSAAVRSRISPEHRLTSVLVLSVVIFVVIVIPLLVVAFGAMRRSNNSNEHPGRRDRRRPPQNRAGVRRVGALPGGVARGAQARGRHADSLARENARATRHLSGFGRLPGERLITR